MMSICYGVDLCEWFLHSLETDGMTPPAWKVLTLFQQMTDAVAHCHKKNILHRDLKLENFLFETLAEKTVRLCDFGAVIEVKDVKVDKVQTKLVGTVAYLAPEAIHDFMYSEKSDVYSLGVILFVLLTGWFFLVLFFFCIGFFGESFLVLLVTG